MGKIYYLIPDIYKKNFKLINFIKFLIRGNAIEYLQKNVFIKHKPVGGIKIMYQHCLLLQELGYEVYPLVMGEYIGNFFGYNLEVKYIADVGYSLTDKDVIVSPEFMPYLGLKFKGCTRVLFNQSQSWRYYYARLEESDRDKNYIELGYDYVINCSEYLCRMLKNELNVDSTAIVNGIEQAKFHPKADKREPGRILALSRKHPEHLNTIKNAIKDLDFRFRIVDGLTESELIEEYQQADIFLATGYPEGFSLPPLEAMSCGCVVVGFSGGGGGEYMYDNVTALVAEDGDCNGVLVRLKLLAGDIELKEKIRICGMKKASEYSLDNTKKVLSDFYQMVERGL